MMPKITKRVVDAIKPDETKPIIVWDSELKGFGVRVMPSGVGSYLIVYRTIESRQRKLVIGRVGTLTTRARVCYQMLTQKKRLKNAQNETC